VYFAALTELDGAEVDTIVPSYKNTIVLLIVLHHTPKIWTGIFVCGLERGHHLTNTALYRRYGQFNDVVYPRKTPFG